MSGENVNLAIVFSSPLADQTTSRIIVDLVNNVKCEELRLRRGSALVCRGIFFASSCLKNTIPLVHVKPAAHTCTLEQLAWE